MTVKLPIDPRTMPDGVVLILNVRYRPYEDGRVNDTIYTHAALKSGGFWYLTGSRAPQVAGWGAVENWLDRDNRELVSVEIQTGARTIWPEPVEVAAQDDVAGSWGHRIPDGTCHPGSRVGPGPGGKNR